MKRPRKKKLVKRKDFHLVPLNYLIAKYQLINEEMRLNLKRGRHIERTFPSTYTQNQMSTKQYFYKPITRYGFQN